MAVRLLLTRHGETEHNVEGRYAGSTDVPLNANGMRQAEELSKLPLLLEVDVIASSPLIRAVQTAVVVQRRLGKPLHIHPEFRERCVGVYEGLTREEAQARYPAQWNANITGIPDCAPDGGETLVQVTERIRAGLEKLLREYDGKTILLVAHGYVSREINRLANGWDYQEARQFLLNNAQVKEYSLPLKPTEVG